MAWTKCNVIDLCKRGHKRFLNNLRKVCMKENLTKKNSLVGHAALNCMYYILCILQKYNVNPSDPGVFSSVTLFAILHTIRERKVLLMSK